MKVLNILPLLICVSGTANAAVFNATPTWCNGPVQNNDVSSCPSFSTWHDVGLKNVITVELPVSANDHIVALTDASGNSWTLDLDTCNTPVASIQGCNHSLKSDAENGTDIEIQEWQFGGPAKTLSLIFQNHDEVMINSDGDNLMFSLIAKP